MQLLSPVHFCLQQSCYSKHLRHSSPLCFCRRRRQQFVALQKGFPAGSNTQLSGHQPSSSAGDDDREGGDGMAAQQVKLQMEALLREKARLAQENDRLLRENTGLQELLDFTMQQADGYILEEEEGEMFDEAGSWEEGLSDDLGPAAWSTGATSAQRVSCSSPRVRD
jgi:hypothetical protein